MDNDNSKKLSDMLEEFKKLNSDPRCKFCTKCGYEIGKDWEFCGHCGNKVEALPVKPRKERPERKPVQPIEPFYPVYPRPYPMHPKQRRPDSPWYEHEYIIPMCGPRVTL